MPREKRNLTEEEKCSKNAQVSRIKIGSPEDKCVEEFMTELKDIQESREEIWKQKNGMDDLPKDLVAARKMTYRCMKRVVVRDGYGYWRKIPESLYAFGDKYDVRVYKFSEIIKLHFWPQSECESSDDSENEKTSAYPSFAADANDPVRGTEQNISSTGIPSCSTAPDPCVQSVSRELNSYSAIYSTRSDIACSSEESANTHVNNEIPYTNDSDIILLSKHVYVSDDESTDKNSPQYKRKLIKDTMIDTLETGYKRIKKEFGNNVHDSTSGGNYEFAGFPKVKPIFPGEEIISVSEDTAIIDLVNESDKEFKKKSSVLNKKCNEDDFFLNKSHSVETDTKAYSTDESTATASNSNWIKYMDEFPELISKLIGKELRNKVHDSTSARNYNFADFPKVKPIFPDEKIIFDSEGRAIIDLVNESDKELKKQGSVLDKTPNDEDFFLNKSHSVETDTKAYSTDGSTATASNSNWIKYMDEFPALISKLIGNQLGNKVHDSTNAGNYNSAGFPNAKPIFPDEKIFDSEGRAIIDLVDESDKASEKRASVIDKKCNEDDFFLNKSHSFETDKKTYSTDGSTATPSNSKWKPGLTTKNKNLKLWKSIRKKKSQKE